MKHLSVLLNVYLLLSFLLPGPYPALRRPN